jgi:hypothetical protein
MLCRVKLSSREVKTVQELRGAKGFLVSVWGLRLSEKLRKRFNERLSGRLNIG